MDALKWDREFALEQAAEDEELLLELLDLFRQTLKKDLAQMEKGLRDGSMDEVRRGAHSIKGAAASLGIFGLSELAKAVEAASLAGDVETAQQKTAELAGLQQELSQL